MLRPNLKCIQEKLNRHRLTIVLHLYPFSVSFIDSGTANCLLLLPPDISRAQQKDGTGGLSAQLHCHSRGRQGGGDGAGGAAGGGVSGRGGRKC